MASWKDRFKKAGEIAVAVGRTVADEGQRIQEQRQRDQEMAERMKPRFERYSDKELMEKFKKAHGAERIAIGTLLRERGYGNNNN